MILQGPAQILLTKPCSTVNTEQASTTHPTARKVLLPMMAPADKLQEDRMWLKLAGEGGMTGPLDTCAEQFSEPCMWTSCKVTSRFLIG